MRTLQRVGAGLCALTLFVGLAACGDDDDADEGTEATDDGGSDGGEQAAGDNAAFCDAVVEFNATVFQVDISEETPEADIISQGEQIAPIFQTIADEAPDSLSASADELNETVQALTEGDAEAFNSDATFEQYTELVSGAVEECGYDTVDVTGIDYAYQGVPETIPAGTTAFAFTNAAESEDHMMAIIKKNDGETRSWDELLELPEDEAENATEFKGEAFAPAGETSSSLAELDAGEYALLCFIGVGSPDVEDGPPHFTQGMIAEFTVE
jgi:hypothetical protein